MDFQSNFSSLFDTIQDPIVAFDNNLRYTYINDKGAEMIGIRKENVIGKKIDEIIPNLRNTAIGKYFYKVVTSGKSQVWEYYSQSQKQWLKAHAYKTSEGFVIFYTNITREHVIEGVAEERGRLLDLSFDAIQMQDKQNKIYYWNKGAERLYGWKAQEIMGKVGYEVFHTVFPGGYKTFFKNLRQKKRWKGMLQQITKSGKTIVVESTWSLIEKNGEISIMEINRDITEAELAKKQIIKNEKKFRSMIDNSSDVILINSNDLKVQYISPSIKKILGYDPKKLIGMPIGRFIHPDDMQAIVGRHKLLLRDGKSSTGEYRVKNKKGEWRWISAYSSNLINKPEINGILTNFRDITEEKSAKQQMMDTQQEHEVILRNIPNGVMVQDSAGSIIYANKSVLELLGYSSLREMAKAPKFDYIYKFNLLNEYGKKFPVENMPGRRALQTKKTTQATVKFVNKKTHLSRWLTITSTVIYKGHERNPLVVNVMQDVTEFKDADVRKDEFISMASHELKTPLTSLKVYMHLLANSTSLHKTKKIEYALKAADQIEKLQQLVSELLDQSSVQQGKLSLHTQEIYFDFFVREFVSSYQETVKNFKFTVKGTTDSIIKIDRYRVEQVLANIFANAVKYSQDKKEILIKLSKKENIISLSIKDFGMGIPNSELDNIFKPYYRVIGKKENTFPGLGMGLFISRDIVKKHGGEISVESKIGKGTTFTIMLPIGE